MSIPTLREQRRHGILVVLEYHWGRLYFAGIHLLEGDPLVVRHVKSNDESS